MRNRRTFPVLITGLALSGLLLSSGCPKTPTTERTVAPPSQTTEGRAELKTGQVQPKRVEGGKYPAVKPDLNEKFNEEKPVYVPKGPDRGRCSLGTRKARLGRPRRRRVAAARNL
jgi:hypothetical protein